MAAKYSSDFEIEDELSQKSVEQLKERDFLFDGWKEKSLDSEVSS